VTERDEVACAAWCHDMASNFTAIQLVFLDESSKDDCTMLRRYSWALHGQAPVDVVSLNQGIQYSILPALTVDSYMAVRTVEGSIEGAEFYDFVLNDVVSTHNLSSLSHS